MKDYSEIRVLIVDADSSVRERLSDFLRDYGFETEICGSAKEARDLMYTAPYDVCITELNLPGFTGEDLIHLASNRFPEQRYIIHTDELSYVLPEKLKALGMRPEYVFHKPVRVMSLLVKCIKELVDGRKGPSSAGQDTTEN